MQVAQSCHSRRRDPGKPVMHKDCYHCLGKTHDYSIACRDILILNNTTGSITKNTKFG